MRRFLSSLLSGDEKGVDAVNVMSLISLLSLIATTAFVAYHDPGSFSPAAFAGALLLIIGAGAASKTGRDRLSTPPAVAPGAPQ